jgi:hypothetical protein
LGYDNSTDTESERQAEFRIFSIKEQKSIRKDLPVPHPLPNPVFLYDTSQLKMGDDGDKTVTQQQQQQQQQQYDRFVTELKQFLGLSQDFPPMMKLSPGKKDLEETEQAHRNALKVNICDDAYAPQRTWAMESGARSSKWITGYFLKSPHVSVGNREHFVQILESYGKDPCIERARHPYHQN